LDYARTRRVVDIVLITEYPVRSAENELELEGSYSKKVRWTRLGAVLPPRTGSSAPKRGARVPATNLVTPAPVIPRPDDYDRCRNHDCRRDVPRSRVSGWHDDTVTQRCDKYRESES
jgi:hypothetical protein